jgi:hypothetical protein
MDAVRHTDVGKIIFSYVFNCAVPVNGSGYARGRSMHGPVKAVPRGERPPPGGGGGETVYREPLITICTQKFKSGDL